MHPRITSRLLSIGAHRHADTAPKLDMIFLESFKGSVVARAQGSVGVAQVVAGRDPRLVSAFHDSFMAAMSTACVVVGLLCLAAAVAAAFLLPGRLPAPVDDQVAEAEPVAAC